MQAIEVFPSADNEANLQLNADGSLRHLLTLKGLDKSLLVELLDDAERFVTPPHGTAARSRSLAGHTVANGVAVRMAVLECVCKAMEGR
jgi:aspartate carbamoyltransferase catalytic subunit